MDAQTKANLLAWWLQAGVVVLVAAPLPRLLGLWSPRVRMAYWRVVLVGCVLLPLLQPWTVRPEPPVSAIAAGAAVTAVGDPGATATVGASPVPIWRRPLPLGVAEVLVAGALLRLGWLGLGVITVGRLRRSARRLWPRPGSIDRAATLAETDAEFLVSATASRPVTCGVLWPVVLVPRNFESFPEHEQTAIACHELLHVNRSDWLRNAIDEVVRAALWFHPAIWWLINQIQLAREQVVDRESVRRLGARQAYLEALLRMARPAPRLNLSPATLFLKRAHLRQRVTLIVKEVSMSKARLSATLVVMAAVIFVGGSFATSAFPLQQAGAAKPGVQAPAPKLAEELIYKPVTMRFAAGTTARQALKFLGDVYGVTFIYEQGIGELLDANIGPIEEREVWFPTALSIVMSKGRLTARNVGERAIFIGRGAGVVAGATGAARPGVATGVGGGTGTGAGRGTSAGVSGGVAGGVPGGVAGGVSGGVSGGVVGGVQGGVTGAPARDAATWRASWPQDAVVVGRTIKPPTKIVDVKLVYPEIARTAGVQGMVICEVLIGPDGKVADAHILRSIALLDQAALDAVRQWEYVPMLLNGVPVPAIMTLTVNFALDSGVPNTGTQIAIQEQTTVRTTPLEVPAGWPPPIRVGGNILQPTKVVDVRPVYPAIAAQARIQGTVICEALIGPDGKVADARILRSIALLDQAALDAVRQWEFNPTLLNGSAVPVIMTVTVTFTLEWSAVGGRQ